MVCVCLFCLLVVVVFLVRMSVFVLFVDFCFVVIVVFEVGFFVAVFVVVY